MNEFGWMSSAGVAAELVWLLASAGADLRSQAVRAREKGSSWAVLVGDVARIVLSRAPLDIVLGALDAPKRRTVVVAMPVEVLIRALAPRGDNLSTAPLVARLADMAPDDCPCLVATATGLHVVRLPARWIDD